MEEVIENTVEAMDEVKSFRQDTDVKMKLYFIAEDMPRFFPMDMEVELNAAAAFDRVDNEMVTLMDIDFTGADSDSFAMDLESYLVDDVMYLMIDYPVVYPMWTKSEMQGIFPQQMYNFQILTEFLQMAGVEVMGTERKEGINCYVLEITPDVGQIFLSLMLPAVEYDTGYPESDLEIIGEIFSDFSIKL